MPLRGKLLQYYVFCAGAFSMLLYGLHFGWPSPSLPQLLSNNSTIPLTNSEGSWIASIFLIGIMCGSILSALTFDVIGRKKMMIMTSLPSLATWLMIAYARSSVELYVARFIAGISEGLMFCSFPLFLAEICNSKIRGLLMTGITVVHLFGAFLANLLGSFFDITIVALICSGLSLGPIFLCLFVPESPYFYMIKGDVTRAKRSTEKFSGNNNTESTVYSISKITKEQEVNKGKWLQLFTDASNRKSLCLVILLTTFQQLSGFTGILFYIQTVFEETEDDVNPIAFISIYYLLQITVSIINATVIDKVGRRPLLITSISIIIVSLSVVTIYFTLENVSQVDITDYSWLPIFGFFMFIVGFTIGLQNIPVLLVGEIFPLHVKASASGISNIVYGLSATAVSKFFQSSKDEFGMHVPFIVFTICSMCSLPFVVFCIPETKRKTLDEIQDQIKVKEKSILPVK